MDSLFFYLTWLGSIFVLFPAAVTLIALFSKVLSPPDMGFLLGSLLGSTLIAQGLKLLIARPRPAELNDMLVNMPTDYSFPSAHTAQAASFFVALALLASRDLSMKANILVCSLCGLLISLVGFSRIFLKVHYISDVIAGAIGGIVWVFILKWLIYDVFAGGAHAQ